MVSNRKAALPPHMSRSDHQQGTSYMHDTAQISKIPVDCSDILMQAAKSSQQAPISVWREIIPQDELLFCQKIVICSFSRLVKCDDPGWRVVGAGGVLWIELLRPVRLANTQQI